MAFGAKHIAPIDTKPGIGVGVSIPFNAPGVFTTTYTTQKATQSNLINFFLTNKEFCKQICILIFFYVFPTKLFNQNPKTSNIHIIVTHNHSESLSLALF